MTPNGFQSYGQSEVSTAAIGSYVVEAWNDATGFFALCGAPMFKDQLTGLGFSADRGSSFTDLGGLPNQLCASTFFAGDPSVEVWQAGKTAYFYISSIYITPTGNDIGMDVCAATGTGSSATLTCNPTPIVIATGGPGDFLDKEFLSIDPAKGRLYASYTRFGPFASPTFNGQIELAVCDIGPPSGGAGPSGGTAGAPVCSPGSSTTPYLVVAPGDPNCENEGAYPAVHVKSGDVYVAWEFNWATAVFVRSCANTPIQNMVAYVPSACLTLTPTLDPSLCTSPPKVTAINVSSMMFAFVPGYNRFPMSDFPRIAVSDPAGTVSIVWNDARRVPTGDILLQSLKLVSLDSLQKNPIRLNSDTSFKWKLLPALRNADREGNLNVSWYDRHGLPGALTDVWAALGVDPRTSATPNNTRVTTEPTDWNAVSSDIIPNFGDYTDNYVLATAQAPYTGEAVYVAWSDGRMGLPQPFIAGQRGGHGD